MSKLIIFNEITDLLSAYCYRITQKNKLNLTDEANFAEDVTSDILSTVMDITLKNMNIDKPNVTAVDLEDSINKVQSQVTTAASGFNTKKDNTIAKFLKEPEYNSIEKLVLLFFTSEKVNSDILNPEKIRNNCTYVGYDLKKLLAAIKVLDAVKQSRILQIIKPEFGGYDELSTFSEPKYKAVSEYIERRYATPGSKLLLFDWIGDSSAKRLSLIEMIEANLQSKVSTRLLIRADAAMGKSKELENAAHYFSDLKKGILPVVVYLKNFDGELDTFISGFQKQWQRVKPRQLLLLFDGIDEIASELLERFIRNFNLFLQRNQAINVIATIRANFNSQDIGAAIDSDRKLQELRLGFITDYDISWYINKRLNPANISRFEVYRQNNWVHDLIYSPFYLANIIDLIIDGETQLPTNRAGLIECFIQIKNQKDYGKYGDKINIAQINHFADKLALYLTLTGKNALRSGELNKLTELSLAEIRRSSLFRIEQVEFESYIAFDHNNFQEYLAAKHLRSLPWKQLEMILFHEVMPTLLKPKMANTVNFLFSMFDTDDPILQILIEKLISDNQATVLKFEREKINRNERLTIFKRITDKGFREKIYWLGGDIRANELVFFVEYSEKSLNLLTERLANATEHYTILCLFDLINQYPKGALDGDAETALLDKITSIVNAPEGVLDHIERGMEALIHFGLGDLSLLTSIKKNAAAGIPQIRLLILKYITVLDFPDQFDFYMRSGTILTKNTRRSLSNREGIYFEYLISHLDQNNAITLISYLNKEQQFIEQLLDNSAFLRQKERPVDKLYRRLAEIYNSSKDEQLWESFINLVKQVARKQRHEKIWGNQDQFFKLSDTQQRAFFELFNDPQSTPLRQVVASLFKKDYIPTVMANYQKNPKYHWLHRWGNYLLDNKHQDAAAFREALNSLDIQENFSKNWNEYDLWQNRKRLFDLELLSSYDLFIKEAANVYQLLIEVQAVQPTMTMMQLQFEDRLDLRNKITNNLIYDTMVLLHDPVNPKEFEDNFQIQYNWNDFVYQTLYTYIQNGQYEVPSTQIKKAVDYLQHALLPQFSLKKNILVPQSHSTMDHTIMESTVEFLMRMGYEFPEHTLLDFITICHIGIVDRQYEQENSEHLTLALKIREIIGDSAFDSQVLKNLKDRELPAFVINGQATIAGMFAIRPAIPVIKNLILNSTYSHDMKDGLVDALKQLSASTDIFVSLFDKIQLLEHGWQFNVCRYLYEIPSYTADVVTLFENSVHEITDLPAYHWLNQVISMGIAYGSKKLAVIFLSSLKGHKSLPSELYVRTTDFEVFAQKEGVWLIETCLELLQDVIGSSDNMRHQQTSEFLEEVIRLSAVHDPDLVGLVDMRYDDLIATYGQSNPDFNYIQWYKIRLKKAFATNYQELETPESALKIIGQLCD